MGGNKGAFMAPENLCGIGERANPGYPCALCHKLTGGGDFRTHRSGIKRNTQQVGRRHVMQCAAVSFSPVEVHGIRIGEDQQSIGGKLGRQQCA